MKVVFVFTIAAVTAVSSPAGELVDGFVRAAKIAYGDDANCTTSIVRKFCGKDRLDDREPGMVEWIAVEGACNVRDIGGWTGLRKGRVFRGSRVGKSKARGGYSEYTEKGQKTFLETMKIKTDFDLRGQQEFGTNVAISAIDGGMKVLHHPIGSYMDIYTYKGSKPYGEALREFANPEIFPTYVHCHGGADRTGTLCFLLETLCGVPVADATIDYELTSFSLVGLRYRSRESTQPFATMVRTMSTFPGVQFADKVAYWAEHVAGLTKDEINAIRTNMKAPPSDIPCPSHFRDDPAKYWNFSDLSAAPKFRDCPESDSAYPGLRPILVEGRGPNGSQAEFFCYYALPDSPKPDKGFPAVLLVHGGGGTAYPKWTDMWRRMGFAVLAPDWYNQRPSPAIAGRVSLPGGWRNDIVVNVANMVLANSLLRSMPEVDASRTAFVGLSWGSWYGAMVAAVDDRFNGVVEIYCGDAKRRQPISMTNGRFLHAAKIPMWWVVGTNDRNMTPETAQAGFDECARHWGHAIVPELPHSHIGFEFESVARMAKHFACGDEALPKLGDFEVVDGIASAKVLSRGATTGEAVMSYTCDASEPVEWKRKWTTVPATLEGDVVRTKLPDGAYQAFLSLYEADKGKFNDLCGSSSLWTRKGM